MKFYKVFKVIDGQLESAFESWDRKHIYKEGEVTKDRKSDPGCLGLMILCTLRGARSFFEKCPLRDTTFVLHEVTPLNDVTIPFDEFGEGDWDFNEGFTDYLRVGRCIRRNDK